MPDSLCCVCDTCKYKDRDYGDEPCSECVIDVDEAGASEYEAA